MDMGTEYGNRLKQARIEAGLTQVQLSKLTGIAQSTISSAERDGHGSAETPVYASALGVNALWLATGRGHQRNGEQSKPADSRYSTMALQLAQLFDDLTDGNPKVVDFALASNAVYSALRRPEIQPSGKPEPDRTLRKQGAKHRA